MPAGRPERIAMDGEQVFLPLSGIQHFSFCRRQWGLIHIGREWSENVLTAQGRLMHGRAHDECLRERRGDVIVVRGLNVRSEALRLQGSCDVVEFHRDDCGHPMTGEEGLWTEMPVEYKRGASKVEDADRLQLCAQAMCLEEMMASTIPRACLYYGRTHSREWVILDQSLRDEVVRMSKEMLDFYERGHIPKAKRRKGCAACSLKDVCGLGAQRSVEGYIRSELGERP